MDQVLFVDACMRGPELSRTWRLCQHFLQAYTARRPETEVLCRDLSRSGLPLLTAELAGQRERWVTEEPGHPLLAPAREVAAADLIVVGAPCWDLSFPAALKVYLEWASVKNITFRYEEDGQQMGLSRARELIYITTAGGPMDGQQYGCDYVRALAAMLGVPKTTCVSAGELDIWGRDQESILTRAEAELTVLARSI